MPLRSKWSRPYEGFTFDSILALVNSTALNPWLTLPLYTYSLYNERGRAIAAERPKLAQWLKTFAVLSVLRRISAYLDMGIPNNWRNDTYNWSREVVVVTGGSDGIGAIVVQLLAERGIRVVVLDIQPPTYETLPNVYYYNCDLASPSSIRYIAAGVSQTVGHPTVLVLNAGIIRGNKSILQTTQADLKLTFEVNTICHYHLVQAFLPHMISRNHGMIVSVASLAGYVTAPEMVAYSASKAAAMVFYEGLQAELPTLHNAPAIRTVLVTQGFTKTSLFSGFHSGYFINYALDSRTVAEEIVLAILKGRSDHILLPRGNAYIRGLRSWPMWMQAMVRKDLKKLMKGWKGRMVSQPSEEKFADSPGRTPTPSVTVTPTPKSLEGSAVFV